MPATLSAHNVAVIGATGTVRNATAGAGSNADDTNSQLKLLGTLQTVPAFAGETPGSLVTVASGGAEPGTAIRKSGYMLADASGNAIPLASITSGVWTFNCLIKFDLAFTGTWKLGIRVWVVNADLSTSTFILAFGASVSANNWFYAGNCPTSTTLTSYTMTGTSSGPWTFPGTTPFLYFELDCDQTATGATSQTATLQSHNLTVGGAIAYSRSPSEVLTPATDAVTRNASSFNRTIQEAGSALSGGALLGTGATLAGTGFLGGGISTPFGAFDTVSRVYGGLRSISESAVPAVDAVQRGGSGFARSINEALTAATDAVQRGGSNFARTIAESTPAAADAVTRSGSGFGRTIPESVGPASDQVTRGGSTFGRSINESVGPAADQVQRGGSTFSRRINENVGPASDAVVRIFSAQRTINESLAAAFDAVFRVANFNRNIGEAVGVATDSVGRTVAYGRRIAETVGPASDAVMRTFSANRVINEVVVSPPPPAQSPDIVFYRGRVLIKLGDPDLYG